MKTPKSLALSCLFTLLAFSSILKAESVVKVVDLVAGSANGTGFGPNTPQCRFTLVGTNLWFTSNAGGALGFGGVFSYNLSDGSVEQLATLDGTTGTKPWSASITLADGKGWFTTSANAAGAKGSLCSIELTPPYTVNNVFSFPADTLSGSAPHSTPVQIGEELWFTTSGGGTIGSTYGAIVKYNLTNNVFTTVYSLDQTNFGRQPLGSSLVKVANDYFYLTFAGGTNTGFGTPNGAGVLSKISFNISGQPTQTTLSHLPGKFISFPAGDPVYDGTNYLYFTASGVSTNPGAIVRYNMTNGVVTSLFNFLSNAVAVTNYGKQPYGTPVLFSNELYFTTLTGGTAGKGVLGKLNLSNNVVTKLVDFTGADYGQSPQYNGGTLYTNPANGRVAIFFPINGGGANAKGTIVRVSFPPPIVPTLQKSAEGEIALSWSGGYAPYGVDWTEVLGAGGIWTSNWLSGLDTNRVTIPITNSQSYYRIQGASY